MLNHEKMLYVLDTSAMYTNTTMETHEDESVFWWRPDTNGIVSAVEQTGGRIKPLA